MTFGNLRFRSTAPFNIVSKGRYCWRYVPGHVRAWKKETNAEPLGTKEDETEQGGSANGTSGGQKMSSAADSPDGMALQSHYSLRWNNHQTHILQAFEALLHAEILVDVTLVCAETSLRAHKVVLSACR